jgi:hypothetical protein
VNPCFLPRPLTHNNDLKFAPLSSLPAAPISRVFAQRAFSTENVKTYTLENGDEAEEPQPDADTMVIDGRYDEEGTIVVTLNGEEIWVPDIARSIEWCLSTPTDLHLFNETPVIKECSE